jgi:hypothetical protein
VRAPEDLLLCGLGVDVLDVDVIGKDARDGDLKERGRKARISNCVGGEVNRRLEELECTCSALVAEVTARKRRISMAAAPAFPSSAAAAAGAGKPAETGGRNVRITAISSALALRVQGKVSTDLEQE